MNSSIKYRGISRKQISPIDSNRKLSNSSMSNPIVTSLRFGATALSMLTTSGAMLFSDKSNLTETTMSCNMHDAACLSLSLDLNGGSQQTPVMQHVPSLVNQQQFVTQAGEQPGQHQVYQQQSLQPPQQQHQVQLQQQVQLVQDQPQINVTPSVCQAPQRQIIEHSAGYTTEITHQTTTTTTTSPMILQQPVIPPQNVNIVHHASPPIQVNHEIVVQSPPPPPPPQQHHVRSTYLPFSCPCRFSTSRSHQYLWISTLGYNPTITSITTSFGQPPTTTTVRVTTGICFVEPSTNIIRLHNPSLNSRSLSFFHVLLLHWFFIFQKCCCDQ